MVQLRQPKGKEVVFYPHIFSQIFFFFCPFSAWRRTTGFLLGMRATLCHSRQSCHPTNSRALFYSNTTKNHQKEHGGGHRHPPTTACTGQHGQPAEYDHTTNMTYFPFNILNDRLLYKIIGQDERPRDLIITQPTI